MQPPNMRRDRIQQLQNLKTHQRCTPADLIRNWFVGQQLRVRSDTHRRINLIIKCVLQYKYQFLAQVRTRTTLK